MPDTEGTKLRQAKDCNGKKEIELVSSLESEDNSRRANPWSGITSSVVTVSNITTKDLSWARPKALASVPD